MKITLERLPPSYWQAYKRNRSGGLYLTKEAEEFKEEVGWSFKEVFRGEMSDKNFKVSMWFEIADKRRHDVDNFIKLILDALTGIIYIDDDQVIEVCAYKKRTNRNRTTVEVKEV